MLVVHGPTGSINWGYTSTFLRNNYADFVYYYHNGVVPRDAQEEWRNFGAGMEPIFTCPMCNRTLPLALGEVDHRQPKSTLIVDRVAVGDTITRAGNRYSVPANGSITTINVTSPKIVERRFEVRADGCLYLTASTVADMAAPLLPGRRRVVTYHTTGTPLSVLARNDLHNLQLLCGWCNRSKGNR